ncbi:hypothetical protein TrVE_jg787 [Triparma verrucosa]|uniref:Uncharacterized protein n=1 Tax=Triparma verrucosa TaxID=1606542 RepID=A0A9W7BXP8_9STRA|nr:hypothetical protein TrVE_jg787 [Triparma verrucosa]
MSSWKTYCTADSLQLTIVTMSLTPILVLRVSQPRWTLAYTFVAIAMQLEESGSFNASACVLILLELLACFGVGEEVMRKYMETFKRIQLLIVVGFWSIMVAVASFAPENFSFMTLDVYMRACKFDAECYLEDDAKLKAVVREVIGHCMLQMFAYFVLDSTVSVMKIETDKKYIGCAKYLFAWAAVVGCTSFFMTGEIPYLIEGREK